VNPERAIGRLKGDLASCMTILSQSYCLIQSLVGSKSKEELAEEVVALRETTASLREALVGWLAGLRARRQRCLAGRAEGAL
jgi:hypothetical protein